MKPKTKHQRMKARHNVALIEAEDRGLAQGQREAMLACHQFLMETAVKFFTIGDDDTAYHYRTAALAIIKAAEGIKVGPCKFITKADLYRAGLGVVREK